MEFRGAGDVGSKENSHQLFGSRTTYMTLSQSIVPFLLQQEIQYRMLRFCSFSAHCSHIRTRDDKTLSKYPTGFSFAEFRWSRDVV